MIGKAGNTLIPAYLVLKSKGYRVWWERNGATADEETWLAEGPLSKFIAEDAESLLGLVTMRELRGSDWQASDDEIDAFLKLYQAGEDDR